MWYFIEKASAAHSQRCWIPTIGNFLSQRRASEGGRLQEASHQTAQFIINAGIPTWSQLSKAPTLSTCQVYFVTQRQTRHIPFCPTYQYAIPRTTIYIGQCCRRRKRVNILFRLALYFSVNFALRPMITIRRARLHLFVRGWPGIHWPRACDPEIVAVFPFTITWELFPVNLGHPIFTD